MPRKTRYRRCWQALLAERLKLSIHHEMRPLPNNVLLVGKKGPKMRQATEQDEDLDLKLDVPLVHLSGRGSMQQLIDQFTHGLGGSDPWVDMTGLAGLFEIELEFDMSPRFAACPGRGDFERASAPKALGQQLGLRVEVRKAQTDIVLVDRVERFPTDN
jgi:uncharacterized protein (TIGR03435 family)